MATVTLSKAFSFQAAQDWPWDVTAYSGSSITISDGSHTQTFAGSFTFPDMETISGTATSTQYKLNGVLVYKVTGMSVSATKMQTFAETYGDTQATYAYVLRANDTITGSSGNDTLNGYAGADNLTGGAGADNFRFTTTLGISNIDTIKDFNPAADTIQLENAIFKKLATTGVLSSAFFKANTAGVGTDANDYIVYETDTGKLFYDADGNGAGAKVQFALLGTSTHPVITAADFSVV